MTSVEFRFNLCESMIVQWEMKFVQYLSMVNELCPVSFYGQQVLRVWELRNEFSLFVSVFFRDSGGNKRWWTNGIILDGEVCIENKILSKEAVWDKFKCEPSARVLVLVLHRCIGASFARLDA